MLTLFLSACDRGSDAPILSPTPNLEKTVQAAGAAALPTETPVPTPDIDATVEARVIATMVAMPTPTPIHTSTSQPTVVRTLTPIPTPVCRPPHAETRAHAERRRPHLSRYRQAYTPDNCADVDTVRLPTAERSQSFVADGFGPSSAHLRLPTTAHTNALGRPTPTLSRPCDGRGPRRRPHLTPTDGDGPAPDQGWFYLQSLRL